MKSKNPIYSNLWGYDILDKSINVEKLVREMLARTSRMFKYDGLPDTIPANMLEQYLQLGAYCIIAEHEGNLYALTGGLSGECDAYYRPRYYIVANPWLKLDKTYEINKDCVFCNNDSAYVGLRNLYLRYATELVENTISIHTADVQSRSSALITAGDDRGKASAELYLKQIEEGKTGIIMNNAVLESIKTQPYTDGASGTISQLIELHQYLKANWFIELGLNANFNMKREALNSAETGINDQSLLPLIDDMLHCRQEFCKKVNAMFGTNITVTKDGAWIHKNEDIELSNKEEESNDKNQQSDEGIE